MCAEVANICAGIVERELGAARTAGERAFARYGATGARGEVASGFAIVQTVALPVYDGLQRASISEDIALLQVMLHLLVVNDDTNLVSRGGLAGLEYVRAHAQQLLREGGALAPDGLKKLAALDDELIERNLSPGGSADLWASPGSWRGSQRWSTSSALTSFGDATEAAN
jgi:triphosphoribosyl-dephospho-CoA synthase